MREQTEVLQRMLDESERVVFFGGAGVSTDSGIPDYRTPEIGLYSRRNDADGLSANVLSHSFLMQHPEEFFRRYRGRRQLFEAQPNAVHRKLARWEQDGRLHAVVTQNIDGLHQKAGSHNVMELHGSIYRNHCVDCGKKFDETIMLEGEGVPRCECGGMVRPDVVLFGEHLDDEVVGVAVQAIGRADMVLVGGTSLLVYPAAGLLRYFGGRHLAIINRAATRQDETAGLVLHAGLTEAFAALR